MIDAIDKTEYRNHTIKIHVDETAMNPFTDWEGEPPILVAMNDRSRDMSVIEYGLDDSLPDLPDAIVRANWRDMLRGLDYAPTWRGLLALARPPRFGARRAT